jgi:outer membrane protein
MKRVYLALISLALGSAFAAPAQTPAAQHPAAPATHEAAASSAKVAVVEFQAAVGQTNEFQRDFGDLQKKYEPKRQELKTLSDEVDTLTKQLQAQGASLGDAERASRAHTIDEKKKQLDRDTQDDQSDFQTEMQDLVNRVAAKVGATMTDYAQKHGYTLVLDASEQQQAPTVLYAMPSIDITKAVIEAYNEKSGVPAPPPQTSATPDAPKPSTAH